MLPRLCCPKKTLNSQFRKILNVFRPKSRRFRKPQPPTNFMKKKFFFRNISKIVRYVYRNNEQKQSCRSPNFKSTRSSLFFDIFNGFRDIRVQTIAKIFPSPNYGVIFVRLNGQGRFSIRGQLQHTPIFSFKSVDLIVRYPLTNFFAQRDRHTHSQAKNQFSCRFRVRNLLISTSNFRRYSNTCIRSTNMEVKTVKEEKNPTGRLDQGRETIEEEKKREKTYEKGNRKG